MQALVTTYCDLNPSGQASRIQSDVMTRLICAYGEPWWIQVLMNLNCSGALQDDRT